ncbi:hypothetical protein MKZ38_009220 [Zalerion maritima]|uniref:Uncharacterized protein n=1 Tax=Zalerion maritima TaxID=339359 RepID=A0AAD5RGY0_9PEZI|nr:hypothetical protein MKZ38_009220 [Zalerion maritima]
MSRTMLNVVVAGNGVRDVHASWWLKQASSSVTKKEKKRNENRYDLTSGGQEKKMQCQTTSSGHAFPRKFFFLRCALSIRYVWDAIRCVATSSPKPQAPSPNFRPLDPGLNAKPHVSIHPSIQVGRQGGEK